MYCSVVGSKLKVVMVLTAAANFSGWKNTKQMQIMVAPMLHAKRFGAKGFQTGDDLFAIHEAIQMVGESAAVRMLIPANISNNA